MLTPLTADEFTELISSLADFARSQGNYLVVHYLQQALTCHCKPDQLPIALGTSRK